MNDISGDLEIVQQANYLEGGTLMWMLPLYLHVNQKYDDDDDDDDDDDEHYSYLFQYIVLGLVRK